MENKKNTNKGEHMTRTQKVIVVVTAIVLAIILILVIATRYMGSGSTYQIDDQANNSVSDATSDDSMTNSTSDASSAGNGGNSVGDNTTGQNTIPNYPDTPSVPDVPTPQIPSGTDNGGGNSKPSDTTPGTDPKPDVTQPDPTDPGDNSGNTPSNPSGGEGGGNTNPDTPDVGQSGGIADGASVTIIEIGEATISFKIGNETVVIPVQTTIFNGRVTKSGVISDSLCGYSIGASVMLYYPENGSLDGVSLTSSYVKVDSTRLTVSGDYTGDASKIIFRVNGVKLP